MEKTVCFTGHRGIAECVRPALTRLLEKTVEQLILDGATIFRTGGALGFDTLAAECILAMRERYPQIRLELCLPCPTQTRGWEAEDVRRWEEIRQRADRSCFVSPAYYRGVLQARNLALVTDADVCVAYLRSSQGGGGAFTASQALKRGAELINLADALPAEGNEEELL